MHKVTIIEKVCGKVVRNEYPFDSEAKRDMFVLLCKQDKGVIDIRNGSNKCKIKITYQVS